MMQWLTLLAIMGGLLAFGTLILLSNIRRRR